MDKKAQGALSYLLLIGGAVLVAAIVISLVTSIPSEDFTSGLGCNYNKTYDSCTNASCTPIQENGSTATNQTEFFLCSGSGGGGGGPVGTPCNGNGICDIGEVCGSECPYEGLYYDSAYPGGTLNNCIDGLNNDEESEADCGDPDCAYGYGCDDCSDAAFSSGNGTTESPWGISDCTQLQLISGCLDKHFELTNTVSGCSNFTTIGDSSNQFTGSLNGNGQTISGISLTPTQDYGGLFAYIGSGGEVKNLQLSSFQVNGGSYRYIGAIAGQNDGTIINSETSGSVYIYGDREVGGIAGYNTGTIGGSSTDSSTSIGGYYYIGGITGYNMGHIDSTTNNGSVYGDNQNTGGIAGYNSGHIEITTNNGSVYGDDGYAGGITGYNMGGNIESTTNNGSVYGDYDGGNNGYSTGGIAGYNSAGTIIDSENKSSVYGYSQVGGIVGYNSSGGTISNSDSCYTSSCSIVGNSGSSYYVGGLVGENHASISSGKAGAYVYGSSTLGGLIGYQNPSYTLSGLSWNQQSDNTSGNCIGSPQQVSCVYPDIT